jgi:hypothetical protein
MRIAPLKDVEFAEAKAKLTTEFPTASMTLVAAEEVILEIVVVPLRI